MITLKVSYKSILRDIGRRATFGARRVSKRLAKLVVSTSIEEIRQRVKPTGEPQQENSAAWIKRKGHDHPLMYRHVLTDPEKWILRRKARSTYEVDLPAARQKIRSRLARFGYYFADPAHSVIFQRMRRIQARHYALAIEGKP